MKGIIKYKYVILVFVNCFILICAGIILASDKYRIQYVSSDSDPSLQLKIRDSCNLDKYDKVLEGVTISADSDGIMLSCDAGIYSGRHSIYTARYTNDGKLKQEILWYDIY